MDQSTWTPAYIALGSNLGEPEQQVKRALTELAQLGESRLIAQSSLYRSAPMGPQDQPAFVNAVAALLTHLSASELLTQLQAIERRMGRQAPVMRWGPRVIDLDILLHGDTCSDTPALQLPHPGMLLRNFVMVPLAEIAPQLSLSNGLMASAMAQRLGMAGLQRIQYGTHT
ncbi:MAG: 2-amino-4-hydroxy-6-hydroxymethyldihydropteridine diphosphokinase [Steroidobacteraceae bacterium]